MTVVHVLGMRVDFVQLPPACVAMQGTCLLSVFAIYKLHWCSVLILCLSLLIVPMTRCTHD